MSLGFIFFVTVLHIIGKVRSLPWGPAAVACRRCCRRRVAHGCTRRVQRTPCAHASRLSHTRTLPLVAAAPALLADPRQLSSSSSSRQQSRRQQRAARTLLQQQAGAHAGAHALALARCCGSADGAGGRARACAAAPRCWAARAARRTDLAWRAAAAAATAADASSPTRGAHSRVRLAGAANSFDRMRQRSGALCGRVRHTRFGGLGVRGARADFRVGGVRTCMQQHCAGGTATACTRTCNMTTRRDGGVPPRASSPRLVAPDAHSIRKDAAAAPQQ